MFLINNLVVVLSHSLSGKYHITKSPTKEDENLLATFHSLVKQAPNVLSRSMT